MTRLALGRGGTAARLFADVRRGRVQHARVEVIRRADSRMMGEVRRHPWLARLPGLPSLVALEARRARRVPLRAGSYADASFVAER